MRRRCGKQARRVLSVIAFRRWPMLLCAWIACWTGFDIVGAEHHAPFDGPKTEWKVAANNSILSIREHAIRVGQFVREGTGAEFLKLAAGSPATEFELVCPTPPVLRLDETQASVWVLSSQPNLAFYVRLRFPNQIDPRTKEALVADVPGMRYEVTNAQWKKLECRPDDRAFQQLMQRLRHQLNPQLRQQADIVTRDVYVEAVVLKARVDVGETNILLDDLRVGPLVGTQGSTQFPVTTASAESPALEPTEKFSRIRVGDNRITKNDLPFIPLFVPYHHETIEQFKETGANVAWVERYDDPVLLKEFAAQGIGVTATPPRIPAGEEESSLPPFTGATAPIDFWMLDVRIPGSALPEITEWIDQVREADQQHLRPILADVTGREREYHRKLSLLGSSRFILGSMHDPRDFADHLERKQLQSLPGKGMFTILQLEPGDGKPHDPADGPRIEPEQVFMMGNAALAAGYKAIGYWNRNPLCDETRHALKLMNLQIRLMEPWLATGKVSGTAPIQIGPDRGAEPPPPAGPLGKSGTIGRSGTVGMSAPPVAPKLPSALSSRWDNPMRKRTGRAGELEEEIRATVISSEFGMLVIVNWLEQNGQFQPGRMQVDDLHLFVRQKIEKAWTLTPTKMEPVSSLKIVPGGTEITLKKFDQYAYILITHEQSHYDAVERQIGQIRKTAAESWIELAALKLRRVHDIHGQLEFRAPAVPEAAAQLALADRMLDEARKNLANKSCNGAREYARAAMALTRGVQRRHWENAVARFSSPVANPYTAAFQTLPEHWQMMTQLGSGLPGGQTLLTVGGRGFESLQKMVDDGWTRSETDLPETIRTAVELRPVGATGRSCLRLAAGTGAESPQMLAPERVLVQLQSPIMVAQPGQLIHVSGKLRIPLSIDPASDGVVISNTLDGPGRGLRFRDPTPQGEWKTFELISEAREAREFALLFELRGLGDVLIDDLRVVAITPPPAAP